MGSPKAYATPKIEIPTEATLEKPSLKNFRGVIHGLPMTGKSTFANDLADTLFIQVDPNLDHLKVKKIKCETWKGFLAILDKLEGAQLQGKLDVELIAVDTIALLYQYCCKQGCEDVGIKSIYDGGGTKATMAWVRIGQLWCEGLLRLTNLDTGVLFVGHTNMKTVGIGANKKEEEQVNLGNSPANVLSSLINVRLKITQKKVKANEYKMILDTRGSRFDVGLPEEMDFVQGETAKELRKLIEAP
jgi:hypothetical protein